MRQARLRFGVRGMNIANRLSTLFVAITILALASCASAPKVRVDQDRTVNFAGFKTFGWLEPASEPAPEAKPAPIGGEKPGEKPAEEPVKHETSSLSAQRMRAAVIAAMQAKGYTLDETQPDVRVSYVLNVYERPKDSGMRIGIGAGGSSGHVGGGVGLSIPVGKRTELIGAMTVDIVDPKRKAQIWTGSFESNVEPGEISEDTAQRLVNTILDKYPSRGAGAQ